MTRTDYTKVEVREGATRSSGRNKIRSPLNAKSLSSSGGGALSARRRRRRDITQFKCERGEKSGQKGWRGGDRDRRKTPSKLYSRLRDVSLCAGKQRL